MKANNDNGNGDINHMNIMNSIETDSQSKTPKNLQKQNIELQKSPTTKRGGGQIDSNAKSTKNNEQYKSRFKKTKE